MSGLTVCLTHDVDRVYKSYQYISHDLVQLKVLPKCPQASFALIVRHPAENELHALGDGVLLAVQDEKMHVIGRNREIEYAQPVAFLVLKEPVAPATSIPGEIHKELSLVASIGNVSHEAGNKVSISSWHS